MSEKMLLSNSSRLNSQLNLLKMISINKKNVSSAWIYLRQNKIYVKYQLANTFSIEIVLKNGLKEIINVPYAIKLFHD